MGNRQNGSIDWADFVYTSDQEEIDKYSLKKNDALFSRTISSELIGKTAKYRSKKFQNYPFPSCSIAEQEVIIETLEEKLSLTDESIKDVLFQLKRSEILCQSILKKACSGQLIKGALDAS